MARSNEVSSRLYTSISSLSPSSNVYFRLKPDTVGQSLDILMFRYKPVIPQNMYNLPHHKCEAVSNFFFRDLPKYVMLSVSSIPPPLRFTYCILPLANRFHLLIFPPFFKIEIRFEASRLLRISIPVDHIGGIHLLAYPSEPSKDPLTDEQETLKRYHRGNKREDRG